MQSIQKIMLIVLLIALVTSCEKDNITKKNIFTKIYSDPNSDISYYPLDIKQAGDESFFILAASSIDTTRTWLNAYVAQIDKEGEMMWSSKIEVPSVNPVGDIVEINGEYFIFCMDNISLQTHVLKIDNSAQTASLVATVSEAEYPLAVSKTPDNGALLLGYDRLTRNSVLTKLNGSFEVVWQTKFRVMQDAEEILVDHLIRTGKTLPFFTGSVGQGNATHYFANGFYNYTLSLMFVDASGGNQTGIGQGYRFDGGASSLIYLQGNTFAMSRFSFNQHFLLPTIDINMNEITTINDYGGGFVAEIAADAQTKTKFMKINGKNAVVYASNTNNNQVILYAYDLSAGTLMFRKQLGFDHPVKVGGLIQTKDEGIGILVQTMVTGRFKRIGFYKLPKEHLK